MIEISDILDIKMYIEDVDAVVFDLDDTLYLEKDYVKSGYKKIAKAYPQVSCFAEKLWEAFKNGEQAIDSVLYKEGLLEEKQKCLDIYRTQKPEIQLSLGVKEMLQLVKTTKKIGIITDGRPEGQNAKIDALGLRELVDEIIITDELGGEEYRKPNKTAFILMAKKLEVPLKKMLYVGDNKNKDFIAPNQLGMQSIWFKNAEGIY